MQKAIQVKKLTKIFPRDRELNILSSSFRQNGVIALNSVSLEIVKGHIHGILGPNGAGKTTLIKILTTSVIPTEGSVSIHGMDLIQKEKEVRKLLGLVNSDERSFFWRLTGRQNLQFFASLYGLSKMVSAERIEELFELLNLKDKADVRFYNYSTGMKQKLSIARGLIHRPNIVFMDEPTRSLDPVSAKELREFIKKIVKVFESTVVLCTHNLYEAEELCDRITILHKGNVLAEGPVEELRRLYTKKHAFVLEVKNLRDTVIQRIEQMDAVYDVKKFSSNNNKTAIEFALSETAILHDILKVIIDNGGEIYYCTGREVPLEQIFYSIVSD